MIKLWIRVFPVFWIPIKLQYLFPHILTDGVAAASVPSRLIWEVTCVLLLLGDTADLMALKC